MKFSCVALLFFTAVSLFAQTNLQVQSVSQPITIFTSNPIRTTSGPDKSVEAGTKFMVDAPGTITALRFYKMVGQDAKHTLSLWDSAGMLLAQATTNTETTSGWQQVNLLTPASIVQGNTYTVSYHTAVGYEALDQNFFVTVYDHAPLHATGGAYSYTIAPAFPRTASLTNYYADVVFLASTPHYAKLTWSASATSPVTYSVFRSTTKASYDYANPLVRNLTVLTYTDNTVQAGQTYYYVVTAVAQSGPSNEVTVVVPTP